MKDIQMGVRPLLASTLTFSLTPAAPYRMAPHWRPWALGLQGSGVGAVCAMAARRVRMTEAVMDFMLVELVVDNVDKIELKMVDSG